MAMMWLLVVLALSLSCLGQVGMEATLGWGGVPVLGRVNPLWVTVDNPTGAPVVGTLQVLARIGSPWRGEARRALSAPVLLAPGGRATFLFPWPVQRGTRELSLTLLAEAGPLATSVVPVSPTPTPLTGTVGGPGPGISLSPADLADPLLLHPLGAISVAAPLSPEGREALSAWAAYLGGELSGFASPSRWSWPEGEGLSRAFARLPLPRPPLAPLALAVATYLLGIGFFLPPACRGRFRPAAISLGVSLGLALFCPVFYNPLVGPVVCTWEFGDKNVGQFHLEFLALTATEAREWRGEGFWVELLPAEEGAWAGRC